MRKKSENIANLVREESSRCEETICLWCKTDKLAARLLWANKTTIPAADRMNQYRPSSIVSLKNWDQVDILLAD